MGSLYAASIASSCRWSPGLLPLLAVAQARRLVAEDRQERHTLGLDQLGHEAGDVERGVVAVKLADLVELGVLSGDVGQPADGDQRHPEPGGRLSLIVHPAVEIEVGFEAVEKPGPQRPRELNAQGRCSSGACTRAVR